MQDLMKQIEESSLLLVSVEADDLKELGDLHTHFDTIKSLAEELADEPAGSVDALKLSSAAVSELIENIMAQEVEDADEALKAIGEATETIQTLIQDLTDGKSDTPLKFHPLLNLDSLNPESEKVPGEFKLPDNVDEDIFKEFLANQPHVLDGLEVAILYAEKEPGAENLGKVKAILHCIKGEAGLMGLEDMAAVCHEAESLIEQQEVFPAEKLFEAKDWLATYINKIASKPNGSGAIKQDVDWFKDAISELNQEHIDKTEFLETTTGATDGADGAETDLVWTSGCTHEPSGTCDSENSTDKMIGEILIDNDAITPTQLDKALQDQSSTKPSSRSAISHTDSTVKVTTQRLDSMIDMVGELVIAQSMVTQDIDGKLDVSERLERNVRHLSKITRELQDLSMSMRMVPVQGVFQKMARLVRDLARKSGKKIEFSMDGGDTEMDRNVVEAIADPLVHMIRNCTDHGIEPPDERQQNKKSPTGKIDLKAFHQGGNVIIEISDDGRGLDRTKILAKAIANGVVTESQELSESEIHHLIFHPGLSTAAQVTDVSGRGVGMDIVQKNLDALRGRIDIETASGKGSLFRIILPLTLAVIDGQITTVGNERFIVPTISIEQSLRPTPEQISTIQGRGEVMKIRENLLPLIRLHRLFGIDPKFTDPCEGIVVVVDDGGQRCCLLVDTLESQQQVVIKSLGDFFGAIPGVSGGAIMGDGNISLILDVSSLLKLANQT